ncbi:hypothetical protein [Glycomyces tritici]|uniref:Uncharacterized protein n=1 Tax=Glycomyces tritici TaxID=2665176 RepID=A0ABT7YRJ4_9ACTN|nr:hypothetical protein [Glycomyces tritici]MDN3241272.1 hypothetical protein [Glycomyces tritici]MDN3243295.1 hypothetical protein [Glycomyces tritici]
MRAFKFSAAALALAIWFALAAAVVVWCVSYLFWGEYHQVTVLDDGASPNCVGTWCSDGTWMRSPATYEGDGGTETITVLADFEPGMEPQILIGPLPGLGLTSRFMAVMPLVIAGPAVLTSGLANVAFWSSRRDD